MIHQGRFNLIFIITIASAFLGIIFGIAGLSSGTGYTNQWCKKVNCTCTAKNPNNCTFKDDNLLYFMTQTSEPVVYKSYQYICPPDYFDCWTTPINSTDVALLLREPQATSTLILFEFSLLFCVIAIGIQVPALIVKFLVVPNTEESTKLVNPSVSGGLSSGYTNNNINAEGFNTKDENL